MADSSAKSGDWYVYIVETVSGRLYTGIALDPERRLAEHRDRRRGAKFFRTSPPARLVYREARPDRGAATRREREIKRMSRAGKLALIEARGGQPSVSKSDR